MVGIDRNKIIINCLLDKGIKININGFWYLHDAVQIVLDNNNIVPALVKDLYPTIAMNYETKWENVERCIRYIRENCRHKKFRDMTNKGFISYIALEISMMK